MQPKTPSIHALKLTILSPKWAQEGRTKSHKRVCVDTETFVKTVVVFPRLSLLKVGGWTQDEPSCPVEQFCPEYNEWRVAAPMVNRRGNAAVGTLGGKVYTAGGQDSIRCYANVER